MTLFGVQRLILVTSSECSEVDRRRSGRGRPRRRRSGRRIAVEATVDARTARDELKRVRRASDDRIAALETRQERELARVRGDLEARLTAEHESLTARLVAVEAERDRLVAQVARDAEERTQLGRIAEAAEKRATALTEELSALRSRDEG